jgi:RHS repeat-associated protein
MNNVTADSFEMGGRVWYKIATSIQGLASEAKKEGVDEIYFLEGDYETASQIEVTNEKGIKEFITSATDDEYGYSGDYSRKNDATNWNEFQYRNYDARIGRWLSPDPMRQYHSPYVGMGNNAVSTFDPTGLYGYVNDVGVELVPLFGHKI